MGNKQGGHLSCQSDPVYIHSLLGPYRIGMNNGTKLMRCVVDRGSVHEISKYQQAEWYRQQMLLKSAEYKQHLFVPYSKSSAEACYSFHDLKIDYQFYPFTLQDEIESRDSLSRDFSESEFWYILWKCVQVLHKLHSFSEELGNLCPNVILANEVGEISIACKGTHPLQQSAYQQGRRALTGYYLPPEDLEELRRERLSDRGIRLGKFSNRNKNKYFSDCSLREAFTLGITMLHILQKTSCHEIFNYQQVAINQNALKRRIQLLHQSKYSRQLKMTVEGLLDVRPSHRLSIRKLYEYLSPKQDIIENVQYSPDESEQARILRTEMSCVSGISRSRKLEMSVARIGEDSDIVNVQQRATAHNGGGNLCDILNSLENRIDSRIRLSKELLRIY